MEQYLTGPEFCKRFRVHRNTVGRWIKEGRLRIIRLPGGRVRIAESEADRFCVERTTGPGNRA